jgi:hypothetical protein
MTKGQKSLQRTTNFGRPVAASIEAGLTVGAISLRTCSHLPPISGSKMVMPVMLPPGRAKHAHIGQSFSHLRAILALLKRGDIVTHM